MKCFEEVRTVGAIGCGFPRGLVRIVVEALPFDKIVQFSSTNSRVEDCIDFPFQFIFDDDWFGRRISLARVRTLGWLEKGNMENWMYLPRRGEFKSESGF